MGNRRKPSIFDAEHELVSTCRTVDEETPREKVFETLETLTHAYAKLLRQTEKITRVGDSIQRKLVKAREEISVKNRRLVEAQNQLVHKEKMLAMSVLVNGVAHEICNPLNFINNFASLNMQLSADIKERCRELGIEDVETLEEILEDLDDLERGACIIKEHGLRAARIVESMTRMTGTDTDGRQQAIDMNYLLESFTDSVIRGFLGKLEPLEVTRDIEPDLPQPRLIMEEVATAVTQLISNACEAMIERKEKEPGYRPHLKIYSQHEAGMLRVSIIDNGSGIADEDREKIFTPFYTTRSSPANIGLGLTTAYDIVVNGCRGDLVVDTTSSGETCFNLLIPTEADTRSPKS